MSVPFGEVQLGGLNMAFFASPIARRSEVEASAAQVKAETARVVGSDDRCRGAAGAPCGLSDRLREPAAGAAARGGIPLACLLTGGTEAQALEWLGPEGPPPFLLALPHSNSLPACLEVLGRLRREGRGGRIIVFGRGDWPEELARLSRVGRTLSFMRSARIGLIGGPSDWLVASSPSAKTVKKVWGPEVVSIPLDVDRLRVDAASVVEPDEAALGGAVALERALRELADGHHLDALTVKCFDLLEPVGNTGCLALSRLNDEGLTAACEGDLTALLTMMVLQRLSGRACFMANPSDLDLERGQVTFAHCSVPLSLTASFRLRSHFESGIGVGIEGHFEPGVMTVARIGGADLTDITVFRGRLHEGGREPREDLCRTQMTLEVGPFESSRLLRNATGNHHVIAPGDHVEAFVTYASFIQGRWRGI